MLRLFKISRETPNLGIHVPPYFDGEKFTNSQVIIPAHDQYNLNDLLSAGVKVSPIDTQIVHDESALSNLINTDKK